jgi:hypothetical protein
VKNRQAPRSEDRGALTIKELSPSKQQDELKIENGKLKVKVSFKFRFWLSAFVSRSIVGAAIGRPVRHGRTICQRQILHGCHNSSV